jgi:hypothetical protein
MDRGLVLHRRSTLHAVVPKTDVWFSVAVVLVLLILMFAVDAE